MKLNFIRRLIQIFFSFIFFIFFISDLTAQDLLQKGIEQYRAENYEEALEIFNEVYKSSPSTTVSFYLGLTYKNTGDYKKAKYYFTEALTKQPKILDAYVEIVEVLYTIDELDEAKKWLKEAEEQQIMPAKIVYLKGLLLLKEGKNEEARQCFERAKALDKSLTQSADLQIALTYTRERKIKEAMNVLKALIEVEPTSDIAEFSKDYMTAIERYRETYKEWSIAFTTGYLYDDNVVSKPSGDIGIPSVDEISGKQDSAIFNSLRLYYRPLISGNFYFLGDINIYTKNYFKSYKYDTTITSITLSPGYSFKSGALIIPIELSHIWLNERRYMGVLSIRPTLNFQISNGNIVQFSTGYAKREMLRYIRYFDPDEDRDSNLYNLLLGYYHSFREGRGLLWARYEYQIDDTEGKNWESHSHRVSGGIIYPVMEKLKLTASADYTWQNFKNIHTLSGRGIPGFSDNPAKRRDRILSLSGGLSYDIFKFLKLNLNYTHYRAESNFSIYDYKRNLYSCELSLNF